jgi:hypothetical protein
LASSELLQHEAASFSPFDTGSLDKHSHLGDPLQPWSDAEKHAFLAAHLGEGADAVAFCAEYVASHFKQAADYVQLPQRSKPAGEHHRRSQDVVDRGPTSRRPRLG